MSRRRPCAGRRAHRRPADRGLAVRPRCCSATPTTSCSADLAADPRGGRPAARAAWADRCAACVAHLRGDAAGRAGGRLRRDLRQPASAQPVPDLLRPRRHPQARDGAAAVQADLPGAPASSSTDAELPDHLCVVLEYAATVDHERGRRAAARPPRRARAAAPLARRGRLALGRRRRGRHRHAAAAAGRRDGRPIRRLAAEGPPEEEVGLTPYATPAFDPDRPCPDGPTPLPMPSFPGAR